VYVCFLYDDEDGRLKEEKKILLSTSPEFKKIK
jgi:hypothetical protein